MLADPKCKEMIDSLWPADKKFEVPSRPFMRLDYKDAIKYLNEHGIKRPADDGNGEVDHVVGDDIAEAAERKMTDQIGRPIFLVRFPREIVRSPRAKSCERRADQRPSQKSFYMRRVDDDLEFTESVDLLMPNVGEIVGGSMRIADLDELMTAYKREGIDPAP